MQRSIACLALVSAALTGCAPVSTQSRPDSYYQGAISTGQEEGSLFAGDSAVLGDDAIARILDYEYKAPPLSRVALMPFGRESFSGWSEELAVASDGMKRDVIDRLRASPQIYDASYLPSILIPETRTVPHLREAAARYQADLLIVYRTYCQSFERYRVFRADESRAFCGVEAVLLDTRTGLVPFTSAVTNTFEVKESDADLNFRETILKAQLGAITTALGEVSGEIVEFLTGSR